MPAIFELNEFGTLPVWGQVLISARMVRRGLLAVLPDATTEFREQSLAACAVMERAAVRGSLGDTDERALADATKLRDGARGRVSAVAQSLWWAIDACRAAARARDVQSDQAVTSSSLRSIGELGEDDRVLRLQLAVLVASDFDLVRAATSESSIGRHDGLTAHVMARLAPVHPLTLVETPVLSARRPQRGAR